MDYGDWIGLGFFALVIGLALFAMSRLGGPRKPMTEEEYESRVREGPGMASAAVAGLQKMLDPGAEKSVEVQRSLKQVRRQSEQGAGRGDEPVGPNPAPAPGEEGR